MVQWHDDARQLAGDLCRLRQQIHAEPEIGLDLPRTRDKVLAALEGLPLEVSCGAGSTSVTAVLRGVHGGEQRPRPAVLLRADMDAIPVQERTGLRYASRVDGRMHACGHDLHTAMLVGAAQLLCAHRDVLAGDVVFMFQPGEEGWEGARCMIEEGVLDAAGRRVQAALALHVFSSLGRSGQFLTREGAILAASARLCVTVRGQGGHGSTPHLARDPVTAAAQMIIDLQTMVTRRFDAADPVVLSVGIVRAGTRRNIIPDTAYFEATIRSFSPHMGARVGEAVTRLLQGVAAAHDVEVDVDFAEERPVTVNDPSEARFAQEAIADLFGTDRVATLPRPLTASEDFSRVLDQVPGAFIALGAIPPGADPATMPFNHSPRAVFDDGVVPDGATVFAHWAQQRLNQLANVN